MKDITAAIVGSTGMIGTYLLEQLVKDPAYTSIKLLVRRPVDKPPAKTEIKLVDFDDPESVKLALEGVDVVFCTIGTTQKNVKGDNKLYRKIDHDIPLNTARFALEGGATQYLIVTAIGADSLSKNFYLRLKGETEDDLSKLHYSSLHIFQPSMLLGERKENRPAEKVLQGMTRFLSKLLSGSWTKYKAIHGATVAAAMKEAAKQQKPGVSRHTYDSMLSLAGKEAV